MKLLFCLLALCCAPALSLPTDLFLANFSSVQAYFQQQPNPPLRTDIGNANLTISSSNANARAFFTLGIDYLHAFWPWEALRAFFYALSLDSNHGMIYWGLHRALLWNNGYQDAAQTALTMALNHSAHLTPKEKLYIQAASEQASDSDLTRYNATMHKIFEMDPSDYDGKSFWAWTLVDASTADFGFPKMPERQQAQDMLLRIVHHDNPIHVGSNHYLIHAFEDTFTPEQALPACAILPKYGSGSGHLTHMPGHVYFLLGDTNKTAEHFNSSYTVDVDYTAKYHVPEINNWEYIHNLAYGVANFARAGRLSDGVKYGVVLQSFDLYDDPDQQPLSFFPPYNRAVARYFFQGLASVPFMYIAAGMYSEAAMTLAGIVSFLTPRYQHTPTSYTMNYFMALQHFSEGMDAVVRRNDADSGALSLALFREQMQVMNETITKYKKAYDYSVGHRSYVALFANEKELEGRIFAAQGDFTSALQSLAEGDKFEKAIPYNEPPVYPRPVKMSEGEVYRMRAASASQAETDLWMAVAALEDTLSYPLNNNSAFAYYGLGLTYEAMGHLSNATMFYNKYLMQTPDQNLPQTAHAKDFLKHGGGSSSSCSSWGSEQVAVVVVFAVALAVAIVTITYCVLNRGRRGYGHVDA
eukprot:m.10548 g.10548  ORF g.10548 m.10548 type:complete len:640 (+) comp7432_c0_seq1:100-2019(+)